MKTLSWLVILASLTGSGTETISFDTAPIGQMPAGWTAVPPGSGAPCKWEVLKDSTAPTLPYVFAQVSTDRTASRFPLAILDRPDVRDGELSVKFKPVSGKEDQSAGLVFRYRDPNNYYVVRANALEKNVVLYKVQEGRRIPLTAKGRPVNSFGVAHQVRPNAWNILKVTFKGPSFSVYYDHRRILQLTDWSYTGPGKVGLWTKADSVTYFDNFRLVKKL